MTRRRHYITAGVEFALAALNFVMWALVGMWFSFGIAAACTAIGVVFIIGGTRASRRADRNHPDPRPSSHSLLGASIASTGGATEGASTGVVDEPVRGWKVANVRRTPDGHVTFLGYGREYGVEAVAECMAKGNHDAPSEGCTCGFYAYNDPSHLGMTEPAGGLLEVEMYGKVICFEKGYRAEKQRVLSVTVRASCCGLVTHPGGYASRCYGTPKFQLDDGTMFCAEHVLEQPRRFYDFMLEPVNCETEWRWAQ